MISLFKENLETLKKSPEYIKNEMFIMMSNVFISSLFDDHSWSIRLVGWQKQ